LDIFPVFIYRSPAVILEKNIILYRNLYQSIRASR